VTNLFASLEEAVSEGIGDAGLRVFEKLGQARQDVLGADGDEDAELAEKTTQSVVASGARGDPGGSQPVKCGKGVLLQRLDRYGRDVFVAMGFEERLGVGTVVLVAAPIGHNEMRRKEDDVVSELPHPAPPVMRRPAGLEQHGGRLDVREKPQKLSPTETASIAHLARTVRNRDLEDVLCKVDGDDRILHFRTPPWFDVTMNSMTLALDADRVGGGVHPINSSGRGLSHPRDARVTMKESWFLSALCRNGGTGLATQSRR
jgi:hypothetical protein